MKPDLLLQEMGEAAKSTNSPDFIFNHLIRVMVPFDALTYSTRTLTTSSSRYISARENVETPNQFFKSVRDQCKSRRLMNLDNALGFLIEWFTCILYLSFWILITCCIPILAWQIKVFLYQETKFMGCMFNVMEQKYRYSNMETKLE